MIIEEHEIIEGHLVIEGHLIIKGHYRRTFDNQGALLRGIIDGLYRGTLPRAMIEGYLII